jgi:hypothetical protein
MFAKFPIFYAVSFFCFLSSITLSAKSANDQFKINEMNGFKLNDFPDFEKKWKMVTVRYRKDTGEMRLTYANESAWEVLSQGRNDYPKGAVFAKIGLKTQPDSAFPSSAVPSGARRFQFMVKDPEKFKDTEGWGYVLFDELGNIFPQDVNVQTNACAACHRLVPDRGYVFSQLMKLEPGKAVSFKNEKVMPYTERIKFKKKNIKKLPEFIQNLIPKFYKEVEIVDHEITKFLFQGTLDEIRPMLSARAKQSKLPVLLLSEKNNDFSLVFIEALDISCESEIKTGFFMKGVSSAMGATNPNYETRYCWVD